MKKIVVKSSIELTTEQKQRLETEITAKENQEVIFSYVIDDVVGGISVINDDTIIDATYNKALENLKTKAEDFVSFQSKKNGVTVEDIPALLKQKVAEFLDTKPSVDICGRIISASDGVIRASGLSSCKYGELLLVGEKNYALALNLEKDAVGAILLSAEEEVKYGDMVYTTGKIIEVPVGECMLGRVVNPLGQPIDGMGPIRFRETRRIESEAASISDRQKVNVPLSTGILAIDSMVPIGRGQRELIIGDRQTGKTSIAIDTIINQKGKGVYCVYVAIGQRSSTIAKIVQKLGENDALKYTIVVVSSASDSTPLQYISPYSGCAMAEYFMYNGKDALIVYDDISKHAVSYRTISLLLKRPSGREAFPGDIFYIHSRLLERSAKLSESIGGGSLSALPIIETQAGDISAYIPTNVISITDGQLYLESDLFNAGQRPAINVGLSVSRVGGSAQTEFIRKMSSKLRLDIAHYKELSVFAEFGSTLDNATRKILASGEKMVYALRQNEGLHLDVDREALYLYAITNKVLDNVDKKEVIAYLEKYYLFIQTSAPSICQSLFESGSLDNEKLDILAIKTAEFVEKNKN